MNNTVFNPLWIISGSGVIALIVIALILRLAPVLGLVQASNERSSHKGQRPTGGGSGVLAGALAGGLILSFAQPLELAVPLILVVLLALVGLRDDIRPLSMSLRLAAQAGAILLLLVYFEHRYGLSVALSAYGPLWLFWPGLIVLGIYWINLFNFMDGIDGLAISESLFVLVSMLGLAALSSQWSLDSIWLWLACIVAASLVFLVFNWAPARIFMGDSGAYFFAFAIFLGAIWGMLKGSLSPFASFILIALFVTDATVTLARRMLTGQKWRSGHRTHAYQYLSRKFSHARACLIYLAANLLWLLPIALVTQLELVPPYPAMFIAYVPLIMLMIWGKAGQPEATASLPSVRATKKTAND